MSGDCSWDVRNMLYGTFAAPWAARVILPKVFLLVYGAKYIACPNYVAAFAMVVLLGIKRNIICISILYKHTCAFDQFFFLGTLWDVLFSFSPYELNGLPLPSLCCQSNNSAEIMNVHILTVILTVWELVRGKEKMLNNHGFFYTPMNKERK